MHIQEDKQIVTWSMIILFLALTIVYSLVYMKKSDFFTNATIVPDTSLGGTESLPIPMVSNESSLSWRDALGTNLSWVNLSNTQIPVMGSGNASWIDLWSLENSLASTNSIQLLSGTTQYFGVLDILDILWAKPEYILQDNKEDFFVYFGEKGLDFVRIVQQLGWTVYTMATESEILENQLFWDKVSFINLQVFKDTYVLMVIELEGKTWMLQVPANSYHSSKSYLKSLFIY
jgi:hypothetical protein